MGEYAQRRGKEKTRRKCEEGEVQEYVSILPTPSEQGIRGEYERERKTESGNSLVCRIFSGSHSRFSRERVDNVTVDLF